MEKNAKPTYQRDVFDITTLDPARAAVLLGDWYFREDKYGDVRGWTEDGRRTPLKRAKGSYSALQLAQNDALNGRLVCSAWPHCQHAEHGQESDSIEVCVREARLERQRSRPGYGGRSWRS